MTGRGRGLIAVLGGIVLAITFAVQVAVAFLLSLCGLGEGEPTPGSWCAVSAGVQQAVFLTPMALSALSYAWTVWRARLTPVLLGGPLLTVIWFAVVLLSFGN